MGKGFESSTGALHISSVGLYRSEKKRNVLLYGVKKRLVKGTLNNPLL
ncbi:hypothetical protein [Enterococcus phage vB_Efs19_KEN17]